MDILDIVAIILMIILFFVMDRLFYDNPIRLLGRYIINIFKGIIKKS